MLKEFKEFALKGNMIDMAVGIIIGGGFGAVVASVVADLIAPLIGLLGGVDFTNWFIVLKEGTTPAPYATLAAAKTAGAITLNPGLFVTTVINFLLIAFAVFLVIRAINAMRRQEQQPPAAPPAPPPQEVLLTEIRDLLKLSAR